MDKVMMALAFLDVSMRALERVQWVMSREGDEFTAEEKAEINRQLAESRQRFQDELAKLAG